MVTRIPSPPAGNANQDIDNIIPMLPITSALMGAAKLRVSALNGATNVAIAVLWRNFSTRSNLLTSITVPEATQ